MKKRLISILAIALIAFMAFVGCSAYKKIPIEGKQNYNYVVNSNGGNAVQYGNYIYFINGTRGYEDENAKNNVFGEVVKGALYRAELRPKSGINTSFENTHQSDLELVATDGLDYDDNEIRIATVQLIAPKVIGTSGYDGGGIFIFDEYVYYATPNNNKNRSGVVQVDHTDFMRSKLDGTKTELIYTTDGVSNTSPYKFYKQGDEVILVCYFDSKIVSVSMTSKKIKKPVLIREDVTSVIFPHKSVYDVKNNITNSPEDFIYFTRNVEDGEAQRAGNVIEIARPNGTENSNFLMNGRTNTLEEVRDGLLFYGVTTAVGNSVIKFDNLHNHFMQMTKDKKGNTVPLFPSYYNYQNSLANDDANKRGQIQGEIFGGNDISAYTSKYLFRGNQFNNEAYMLGFNDSGVFLLTSYGQSRQILSSAASLHFVEGNYMYFTDTEGGDTLYRTEIYKAISEKSEERTVISDSAIVSSGLKTDYVAGFVVYFSEVDRWSKDYAFFKRVDIEGDTAMFVGQRSDEDIQAKIDYDEAIENGEDPDALLDESL